MTDWTPVCVLCAARGRQTRLETGHCCAACATRLGDDLAAIVDLASMAAAWVVPGSTGASGARSVPSSRPPLNVEALDPALASVPGHDAPLLVLLEEWERMTRQMRGMAPYGPASVARSAVGARTGQGATDPTHATLTAVCAFLRAQVEWMTTTVDFPLEDFAAEIRECVGALRRWDLDAQHLGTMVRCPTLTDTGECGYRLRYADVHEDVTCRRCGTTRSAMTLAAVAMADGREVWLDPEAAASWLGVSERTLHRMAQRGQIQRSHGRYLIRHAEAG